MPERVYLVPEMSCGHCRVAIETEIGKVPGVTDVAVDLDAKLVTVRGDTDDADVRAAIDEAGYDIADA